MEGRLTVPFARVGYSSWEGEWFEVKGLWTGDVVNIQKEIMATVPSHAIVVYSISATKTCVQSVTPTGMIINTRCIACLTTRSGSTVTWTNCTGSDEQVWMVKKDRTISSVSSTEICLDIDPSGKVGMNSCNWGVASQRCGYAGTGNVRNKGAKGCLKEGVDRKVTLTACEFEHKDQVFELPNRSIRHWTLFLLECSMTHEDEERELLISCSSSTYIFA